MTPDDLARLKVLAERVRDSKLGSDFECALIDLRLNLSPLWDTILALIEAATPVPVPAGEFAIPAVVEHAPVYFENIDPRLTGRDAPEILRSAAMVVRQQMEFLRGTRRKAWDGSYVEALLKAVERVADSLEGKA